MAPLPLSWAIPAILVSCSETPSVASMTITAILHLSMAATVLIMEYLSISSLILDFLLKPAVSINIYSSPLCTTVVSTASLVVPAISDTMSLFSPISLLIREDLPTFGLPTTAILGLSSSSSSVTISLKCFTTSSKSSPMPCFPAADIGIGSPMPRL